MRTPKKGGGILNRIKGFFTRKKKVVTTPIVKKSVYTNLKETLTKKPMTVYPLTEYPMFKENKRREAVIRKGNSQDYIDYREKDYDDIIERIEMSDVYTKKINVRNMSPATPSTPPDQVESISLPIEPFEDGMRRVFLYFYNRIKEINNQPISPNKLYASDDEINELIYICKDYRFTNYPELLKEYMTYGEIDTYTKGEDEKASLDLFKMPMDSLTKEIKKVENVNHVYPSYYDPTILQFANEYGTYLGRYYPYLTRSLRQIIYANDKANGYNKAPPPLSFKGKNTNRPILKTLDSYYSICCFIDISHFYRFIEQGLKGCSHYIILNTKHFPNPMSFFSEAMPVPITASKFLDMSFIQDAFKEQGVNTMDEDLFTLLQKEAPVLLNTAKVSLVIPSYLKELKLYDHFIVLTEKILPEKYLDIYRDPLDSALIKKAFHQDRQVLLLDPYTAYCTKKKSPQIWSRAFGNKIKNFDKSGDIYWDPNLDTYLMLHDVEKFFVDFCQYQLVLSKYFDLTQNNRSLTVEERLKEASEMYKVPFSSQKFITMMKQIVKSPLFKNFKEMEKNIITYDHPIEGQEDVNRIIQKFSLYKSKKTIKESIEPETIAVSKKKTTFAPLQTRNTARNNLLREQANILHGPNMVTTEGMFKTRTQALNNLTQKAKQQTNFMNQLQTLKKREQLKKNLNRAENIGAMLEGKLPPNEIQREYNALKKNKNLFQANGTRKNKAAVKRFYDNRVALERNITRKLNILKEKEALMKKFALLELVENKLKGVSTTA